MRNWLILITLLVVGALFVPAVSADEIYNRTFIEIADLTIESPDLGVAPYHSVPGIYISDVNAIATKTTLHQVEADVYPSAIAGTALALSSYHWDNVPLTIDGNTVGYADLGFFKFVDVTTPKIRLYAWVHELDVSGYTGSQRVYFNLAGYEYSDLKVYNGGTPPGSDLRIRFCSTYSTIGQYRGWAILWDSWENTVIVENSTQNDREFYSIDVKRNIDGKSNPSVCGLNTTLGYYLDTDFPNSGTNDIHFDHIQSNFFPMTVSIKNLLMGTWHNDTISLYTTTPTPTPTEDATVLRKGIVTMTDNNGTTITGFEVTAVNAYTGEEYTVATETDVAVMNLSMDRTIRLRNPQTGEYEDASVGYYRFYGQSPGYKMLNEDGIQVSVVPEKYASYELCNIRVTPESGPLTGKHLFQIRSRSDNSVLQTGTVSAKSATTGEWFNTTVSGGIATLVLPYDTSNTLSQYAGNYYVYATSPGYEDSNYATQVVVMPHTVSDIRDILLTPIGGIPTPGNVTLRIQAFSETGPGVVNASIFISGVLGEGSSVWDTYTASSTGYLAVSVPGNSTYEIVASGAGYYDSSYRVEVLTEDPPLIEIKLYLTGAPTVEPTGHPTGWPTEQPTGQPTGGIPDDDDGSEGFLMEAVRGIGLTFGVGFATAKLIFGMLLALAIGYATAKKLRGGAAEFGVGLLGGTLLGILTNLLPVWIIVVLLLIVGLYIGNRYIGGNNG